MFISINHIPVTPGREKEFEKMFQERDRSVEKQPGFHSLDVLQPGQRMNMGGPPGPPQTIEGNEYQVLTRWDTQSAFRAWVQSDDFKKSHSREHDKTIFAGKSYLTLHDAVEGASASKESG